MNMRKHRRCRSKLSYQYRLIAEIDARISRIFGGIGNSFVNAIESLDEAYSVMARQMVIAMADSMVRRTLQEGGH